MEVIYCKSSINRKRQFQIITSIIQDGDQKYVLKRPARKEAEKHVHQIFLNEMLFQKYHCQYLHKSTYYNGRIVTPYLKGVSLGELLQTALLKHDEQKIKYLIDLWRQLIIGDETNIVPFYITEDFERIFGKTDKLLHMPATKISNCDCSCENIIIIDHTTVKCIDLEWLFDMPVPVELIFYRVLKNFFINNHDICNWNLLLDYANVQKNLCAIYDQCLRKFNYYIAQDQNGINYAVLGRCFKDTKITEYIHSTQLYSFPEKIERLYKKIALYGAGRVGKDYAAYIQNSENMELCVWIDQKAELYKKMKMPVSLPKELIWYDYDIVLIAVVDENVSREIQKNLLEAGIDRKKIYWSKPQFR